MLILVRPVGAGIVIKASNAVLREERSGHCVRTRTIDLVRSNTDMVSRNVVDLSKNKAALSIRDDSEILVGFGNNVSCSCVLLLSPGTVPGRSEFPKVSLFGDSPWQGGCRAGSNDRTDGPDGPTLHLLEGLVLEKPSDPACMRAAGENVVALVNGEERKPVGPDDRTNARWDAVRVDITPREEVVRIFLSAV